jgi:tetratricopeptide (TPR) repeat protein
MLDLSQVVDVVYFLIKIVGIVIFVFTFKRVLKYLKRKNKPPTDNFDISRLPSPSAKLIGREEELAQLTEALTTEKHLAYIYAVGGIGKSALIFKWLHLIQPDYRGAKKVFAWSFYSQGSHDTQNSSIPFFEKALQVFGYRGELPKDDFEKGRALARCLRNHSFILILDGLEPLQHPAHILDGELKDTALKAFLDDVHYHGLEKSPSLIVISSRQPLVELQNWSENQYLKIDLQTLSPEDGVKLFRKLQVTGTDKELRQATEDMGGHALALVLLGKMLVSQFSQFGGDIARRDKLPLIDSVLESLESKYLTEDEKKLYSHARQVLQWYADFYTENNTPEAIFLDLLSLFDRPMGLAEKNILVEQADCAAPLRTLSDLAWQQLEKTLETASLLLPNTGIRTQWDCHPLIRSYFGQQFKATYPAQFRQAHLVLFEYYQQVPQKQQPDTLPELEPLYRAVVHGCLAGEYKKARELYWERIRRGDAFYSWHRLNAYSDDLTALAAFFPQGWSQPVQQGLSKAEQAWLLTAISYCLMSLGRLGEAIEPREVSIKIFIELGEWENASVSAQNLVELQLPLGQLQQSIDNVAPQAVDYADKSGVLFQKAASRVYLATLHHRQGKLELAKKLFSEAESFQKEQQPHRPQLYALVGFLYCSFLLDQATDEEEIKQVRKRGEYALNIETEPNGRFQSLGISVSKLTIARTYFKLEQFDSAIDYFNQAVENIEKSRRSEHIPYFLIDRAHFYLQQQQFPDAKRDLDEAWQMIERSKMNLYAVDYHLAMSRYARLQQPSEAQRHLETAKALITVTGYHLRDDAVRELSEP